MMAPSSAVGFCCHCAFHLLSDSDALTRSSSSLFQKFGHSLHMIPISGMDLDGYFDLLKPDGVVFGGGYRMYTKEIEKFETRILNIALSRELPILAICCGM